MSSPSNTSLPHSSRQAPCTCVLASWVTLLSPKTPPTSYSHLHVLASVLLVTSASSPNPPRLFPRPQALRPFLTSLSPDQCVYLNLGGSLTPGLPISFYSWTCGIWKGPGPRVELEVQLPASATARSNARSLTHGVRPGIQPASSQRQCCVLNLLSRNGNSNTWYFPFLCGHIQFLL